MNILYKFYQKSNSISRNLLKNQNAIKFQLYSATFTTGITENQSESVGEKIEKDPKNEHKLKVLMLEIELLRQEGRLVPEEHEMEEKHFTELLNLPSRSTRRKYLEYLFKLCRKRENRAKKKQEKSRIYQERLENKPPRDLPLDEFVKTHDLQHNSLFLRIRDTTINNFYNHRLIQAMQFGQKLIVDCGYHHKMTRRENVNCAKQLMLLFGENRIHDDPFDLHFCNYDTASPIAESLEQRIATIYNPEFPLNLHAQSYLDLFPRDRLIYLTPHCKEEMREYCHDSIYIVGAIVDKVNQEPLSLAKAKQEGVRMLKLPLDRHLLWSGGSGKSLTLNQVVAILLDVRKTGNWEFALRHVPRRKIVNVEEQVVNVTRSLLKRKERWSPKSLDSLKFSGKGKRDELIKRMFEK